MAARPKRESRPPKRFIDEVEQPKPCAMKKKPKKDNNLYHIEVIGVDKERKCMKIHFVGYGSEFDEWRDFHIDSDQLPFVHLEKIMFQAKNR